MARSTKRNVKTTQISTNEIREVFNSDSSSRPIPEKSRKASDFFVDGNVENSIYNNFIDEDYCPADEGPKCSENHGGIARGIGAGGSATNVASVFTIV